MCADVTENFFPRKCGREICRGVEGHKQERGVKRECGGGIEGDGDVYGDVKHREFSLTKGNDCAGYDAHHQQEGRE